MRSYSRDDVRTHYGSDRPAVNVKVHDDLSDGFRSFAKYESEDARRNPGFTEAWARENVSEDSLNSLFWDTCAFGFGMIEQDAKAIFASYRARCEQDGRSGGWAVVTGLPPLEQWDAVQLAKWRRFEKWAQAIAADVMYLVVSSLFLNQWECREDVDDPGAESPVAEHVGAACEVCGEEC